LECECGPLFSSKNLPQEHQNGLYWDVCSATASKRLQVEWSTAGRTEPQATFSPSSTVCKSEECWDVADEKVELEESMSRRFLDPEKYILGPSLLGLTERRNKIIVLWS
jgi:hypothetical protein